ncbi:MAG: sigma-54 dependent transcriptional regulator [Syntrophobacterales bacterium]|nr:sigma-54 dependent transcriptional regulator [Syntrophobacterales bacterium]
MPPERSKKLAHILIVEDDINQAKILEKYLTYHGYYVNHVSKAEDAERALIRNNYDIVLLDWHLPGKDGISFLAEVRPLCPFTQFILITAFGTIDRAVEAMKAGAYQYCTKPVNLEELLVIIEKGIREGKLEREVEALKNTLKQYTLQDLSGIIAESPAMKEVLRLVNKVSDTDTTVLISGESGTGKELIADLIHKLSSRRNKVFLKINCAAIPEGLLESELFGHEKGAFTGADRLKLGVFEMAHGGTLFLDEIGDMPLYLQSKLLRVLQSGTFMRLGSQRETKVDVRIIAATNQNLEKMVQEGRFREDLLWRLNTFPIRLPPLRERREDILPLAEYFIKRYAKKMRKTIKGISRDGIERLIRYRFPGNVRELEHIIERAVILADREILTSEELRIEETMALLRKTPCPLESSEEDECPLWKLPLGKALQMLEERRIADALEKSGGVKTKAAELLGISERVLRYKLEKKGDFHD